MDCKELMRVHEAFGKSGTIPDLPATALYALAAPAAEPIREEVLERVDKGEKVTAKEIEELKVNSKPILDLTKIGNYSRFGGSASLLAAEAL
jgi:hypothetical protein